MLLHLFALLFLLVATSRAFQCATTQHRPIARSPWDAARKPTVASLYSPARVDASFYISRVPVRTPVILFQSASDDASDELVARRIIVKGDVQGGYYRACVVNEAGKFRRLVGTMSPPDDTDEAEIYVEGKRNMVEGFVRWCQRSKVGMSQLVTVKDVHTEEPTGLYEGFYAPTQS